MKRVVVLLSLLAPLSATAAQGRPEILVLGTYHMANPGHDIHNVQVDDVLSPKRQQEMTQLIEDPGREITKSNIGYKSDSLDSRVEVAEILGVCV